MPIRSLFNDPDISSLLVVDHYRGVVTCDQVEAICQLIKDVVAPWLTPDRACRPSAKQELMSVIKAVHLPAILRTGEKHLNDLTDSDLEDSE